MRLTTWCCCYCCCAEGTEHRHSRTDLSGCRPTPNTFIGRLSENDTSHGRCESLATEQAARLAAGRRHIDAPPPTHTDSQQSTQPHHPHPLPSSTSSNTHTHMCHRAASAITLLLLRRPPAPSCSQGKQILPAHQQQQQQPLCPQPTQPLSRPQALAAAAGLPPLQRNLSHSTHECRTRPPACACPAARSSCQTASRQSVCSTGRQHTCAAQQGNTHTHTHHSRGRVLCQVRWSLGKGELRERRLARLRLMTSTECRRARKPCHVQCFWRA